MMNTWFYTDRVILLSDKREQARLWIRYCRIQCGNNYLQDRETKNPQLFGIKASSRRAGWLRGKHGAISRAEHLGYSDKRSSPCAEFCSKRQEACRRDGSLHI
jgi:hypothetical protein